MGRLNPVASTLSLPNPSLSPAQLLALSHASWFRPILLNPDGTLKPTGITDLARLIRSNKTLSALSEEWGTYARAEQKIPPGLWQIWLILAGRGWGKTRTGAETVNEWAQHYPIIHLVGPTAADYRDVMVGGESGLIAKAHPSRRPTFSSTGRRVTWPNGAYALCFSAEEPDRLRGPQCYMAWADELAAWQYPEAWDMLMFGLRLGTDPRVVATTTPKPTPLIRELIATGLAGGVLVTKGTTYDNATNLAKPFLDKILRKYKGTRLGRQELEAEILDDMPGALWTLAMLDAAYVAKMPEQLDRIVVAIDPAVTSAESSDETGIVVAGTKMVKGEQHGYVLADLTCKQSPRDWAKEAIAAYHWFKADRIVAEVNNGGDLVETVLRQVDPNIPFTAVHASRGKRVRAEPVSALYEQDRIHHVGRFVHLEDQMRLFNPEEVQGSPDRVDALVWAFTDLIVDGIQPGVFVF